MADLSVELTHVGFSKESFNIMGLSDAAEVLKTAGRELTGEDAEQLVALFAAWESAEEEAKTSIKVAKAKEAQAARAFQEEMECEVELPYAESLSPKDLEDALDREHRYLKGRFWKMRDLYQAWQRRIDEHRQARHAGRISVKQAKMAFKRFIDQDWRQQKLFSY